MKRVTAILLAMMLLLGLLAGCQDAPVAAAGSVVVLESGTATELQVKKDTLAQDIEAAINAMIQSGALTENENTVLATVKSTDAALADTVLTLVGEAFTKAGFEGAVLCQKGEEPAKGKAQLIQALVAADDAYTADALADVSVNTLNLLCENVQIDGLLKLGAASRKALVDADTAIDVALYYVNIDRENATDATAALVYNDLLYYDVRYTIDGKEQEAYVAAANGELLYSGEVGGEQHDFQEEAAFTEENAIGVACAYHNVDVAAAKDVTCQFNEHSNPPYFEVNFTFEGKPYQVLIASSTGMVLETVSDEDMADHNQDEGTATPEENIIPSEDAVADEDSGLPEA